MARKNKRGRPKQNKPAVTFLVRLWLKPGEDDDLIAAFGSVSAGSLGKVAKLLMRNGIVPVSDEEDKRPIVADDFDSL